MKPIEQTLDELMTEYKLRQRESNYYDGHIAVIRRLKRLLKIEEKPVKFCPFIASKYSNDKIDCLGQKCGCWNFPKNRCGMIK